MAVRNICLLIAGMKIEIITPDKKIFEGEIKSVRVPGKKGSFQVLKDHAPIISTLENGTGYNG